MAIPVRIWDRLRRYHELSKGMKVVGLSINIATFCQWLQVMTFSYK